MIEIAVLALACWRITSLLYDETGPYNVLIKFRHFIGVRYDEHSQRYGTNQLAEMFNCSWCLSIWIGLVLGITYYFWRDVWWIALPLALSTVAIIVEHIVGD